MAATSDLAPNWRGALSVPQTAKAMRYAFLAQHELYETLHAFRPQWRVHISTDEFPTITVLDLSTGKVDTVSLPHTYPDGEVVMTASDWLRQTLKLIA